MLRPLPRVLSTVSQGYRAGPATLAVHGERYGERPSAASPPTLTPDMGGSQQRQFLPQLTPRRGITTGYTQQMMSYSDFNPHAKNLVNPIEYYKKKRIIHRVHNKLITKADGGKVLIVHDDTAFSIQSLTGLVVNNHLNNISVSKALCPENVVMDWETGEYAFLKLDHTNTAALNFKTEMEDFRALRLLILHFLVKTHGRDAMSMLPFVFEDFMNKLLSDDLKLRIPLRTNYCPFRSLIIDMFRKMPFTEEPEQLDTIVFGNTFLKSVHGHMIKDQKKWTEKEALVKRARTQEEVELDLLIKVASRLIGIMRHSVLHFPKVDLPVGSEDLLLGVDIKKVIHMLNDEFPDFEQKVLELLEFHDLWDYVEVSKLFGKYAARLKEVIERDKRRAAEKAAMDKRTAAEKAEKRKQSPPP